MARWTSYVPDDPVPQADPRTMGTALIGRLVAAVIAVALLIAALYLVGLTHPAKRGAIASDRLGPDSGESVSTYLSDAAAGLARVGGEPRWALISLRAAVDDDTAWMVMAGTLQSQVALHVPIAGVATPVKFAAVTGDRGSLETARTNVIAEIADDPGLTGTSSDRDRQVSAVTTGRLRAGCACIVAMVVRASGPRLRAIASSAAVRGVEVLPADAAGGRFGLGALLPEQTDRVEPLDDTAVVPAR